MCLALGQAPTIQYAAPLRRTHILNPVAERLTWSQNPGVAGCYPKPSEFPGWGNAFWGLNQELSHNVECSGFGSLLVSMLQKVRSSKIPQIMINYCPCSRRSNSNLKRKEGIKKKSKLFHRWANELITDSSFQNIGISRVNSICLWERCEDLGNIWRWSCISGGFSLLSFSWRWRKCDKMALYVTCYGNHKAPTKTLPWCGS